MGYGEPRYLTKTAYRLRAVTVTRATTPLFSPYRVGDFSAFLGSDVHEPHDLRRVAQGRGGGQADRVKGVAG